MDVDIEEARFTFETNFFAVIRICQTFLPLLMKSKGTIVQIGSVAGVSDLYRMCYPLPVLTYPDNTIRLRLSLQCVQGRSPFLERYTTSRARSFRVRQTYLLNAIQTDNSSVKVTTVITGGVKSRIARTDRDLPPNSLYRPIDPEYQRRTKHSQEGGMPHEEYARSVVSQVLLGPWPWRWLWPGYRKYIWEGNRSSLIKFLNGGWLWYGLFDRVFTRMFALWKLKRIN